jgi:pyruvate kinase
LISKYRPKTDIYAFSYMPGVCNRVNLLWGVTPVICDHTPVTDDMVRGAERLLWQRGVVHNGDVIGIVAGTRTSSGSTNFMRLHSVGSMDFEVDGGTERRKSRAGTRPSAERRKSATAVLAK